GLSLGGRVALLFCCLGEVSRDVGSIPAQPLQWRQAPECDVRTFSVVVGDVEGQRKRALVLALPEAAGVEALALDRAVEALDAAIGPGVVGTGAAVPDPDVCAGLVEASLVPVAVVAQDTARTDPVKVEEREGGPQERDGVVGPLSRAELGIHQTTRHIDRHMEMTPPDEVTSRPAPARTPA